MAEDLYLRTPKRRCETARAGSEHTRGEARATAASCTRAGAHAGHAHCRLHRARRDQERTSSRPACAPPCPMRDGLAELLERSMRTGSRCPLKKPSADPGRIFPVSEWSSRLSPAFHRLALLAFRLRSSEELELAGDAFLSPEPGRRAKSVREGGGEMWCTVAELDAAPSKESGLEHTSSLSMAWSPAPRKPPACSRRRDVRRPGPAARGAARRAGRRCAGAHLHQQRRLADCGRIQREDLHVLRQPVPAVLLRGTQLPARPARHGQRCARSADGAEGARPARRSRAARTARTASHPHVPAAARPAAAARSRRSGCPAGHARTPRVHAGPRERLEAGVGVPLQVLRVQLALRQDRAHPHSHRLGRAPHVTLWGPDWTAQVVQC